MRFRQRRAETHEGLFTGENQPFGDLECHGVNYSNEIRFGVVRPTPWQNGADDTSFESTLLGAQERLTHRRVRRNLFGLPCERDVGHDRLEREGEPIDPALTVVEERDQHVLAAGLAAG